MEKVLSKNQIAKKLNKKLAKAIHVILFHEKKDIQHLFSNIPKRNMFIYHFGNGDEDDQIKIKDFFNTNFSLSQECKVYIFPGISYGFLQFANEEDASKVVEKEEPKEERVVTGRHNVNTSTGERTMFTFYSQIELNDVIQNSNLSFPIANYKVDIPGLYVIDDFLTEEEETKMINDIDANEWKKLSNRRVQHYGYEFIYGANNINKNNKIGELPSFCDIVMKSNI